MGIGASSEVLTVDEIDQEKSTKADKRMDKEETNGNTGSTLGKEDTSKASEVKRNTGGPLEERGVLALERMADSMEALVRTTKMRNRMVMESSIK